MKATEIRVDTAADGAQVLAGYAVRIRVPSVDFGKLDRNLQPWYVYANSRESHQMWHAPRPREQLNCLEGRQPALSR